MAWIESHTVLIRHKKLILMAKELRLKPVYLMGHLHALWHVAMEQQEDGDLSSWSDELISEYSEFQGDALQYVRLLQKYGWLDGKVIHDWMDYAGRYLDNKYRTSNPDKLRAIKEKHSRTKVGLKSDCSPTLVRQPNQPYQPTIKTSAQKAQPTADFSKEFVDKAKTCGERGFNIYALTGKFYKLSKLTEKLPEAVLLQVMDEFICHRNQVKDQWPYFLAVLKEKSATHFAKKNEKEGEDLKNDIKKQPMLAGEILSKMLSGASA